MNPYQEWEGMFRDALSYDVPELKVTDKITFLGIGGSGIVGRVLELIELPVRLEVYRGFKVKGDPSSSLILVSYSGETTETLVALRRFIEKGYKDLLVVTSNGILLDFVKKHNIKHIELPRGYQTRFVFPYIFSTVLKTINISLNLNLRLEELIEGIADRKKTLEEVSVKLVEEITGRIPVFYSSEFLPIAERFKQEINENAKYPAFFGEIPEVIHNELEVYSRENPLKSIVIGNTEVDLVFLELSNGLLIKPIYNSILKNISSLTYLAGITSISLAKKLNVNPLVLEKMRAARERVKSIFKDELKYYYL